MKLCVACGAVLTGQDWSCRGCGWRATTRDGIPRIAPHDGTVAEAFNATQAGNGAAIDPGHFWFRARNDLIAWSIGHYYPGATSMLEVGCGTGHVLRGLAAAHPAIRLTGTEVSPESLGYAARTVPSAELLWADVRNLPYAQEFDLAGVFDVLEHIPDDVEALRAVGKTVRDGGGVLITVPQHPSLWSPIDDYSGHQRRYTRAGLLDVIRSAGLSPVRVTSLFSMLLPGMMLSRWLQRHASVALDLEFAVSAKVNAAAMAVMRCELAAIRLGISMPAGGSLLAVARVNR